MTPSGELYRDYSDVPEDEQGFRCVAEVMEYSLDEEQSYRGEDYEWPEDGHEECEPALYDEVGYKLRDEFHYHPKDYTTSGGERDERLRTTD